MLKIIFIVISVLLALILILYKLLISKLKRTSNTSVYISFMTGMLLIYILGAFVLSTYTQDIFSKIIIFVFGLSPFIVGKFATYEKENLYSWIQISIITFGIFYVLLM